MQETALTSPRSSGCRQPVLCSVAPQTPSSFIKLLLGCRTRASSKCQHLILPKAIRPEGNAPVLCAGDRDYRLDILTCSCKALKGPTPKAMFHLKGTLIRWATGFLGLLCQFL